MYVVSFSFSSSSRSTFSSSSSAMTCAGILIDDDDDRFFFFFEDDEDEDDFFFFFAFFSMSRFIASSLGAFTNKSSSSMPCKFTKSFLSIRYDTPSFAYSSLHASQRHNRSRNPDCHKRSFPRNNEWSMSGGRSQPSARAVCTSAGVSGVGG